MKNVLPFITGTTVLPYNDISVKFVPMKEFGLRLQPKTCFKLFYIGTYFSFNQLKKNLDACLWDKSEWGLSDGW